MEYLHNNAFNLLNFFYHKYFRVHYFFFDINAKCKQRLVYKMPGKEILNYEKVLELYLKNLLASNSAITKELHSEINCRIHYQMLQTVKNY